MGRLFQVQAGSAAPFRGWVTNAPAATRRRFFSRTAEGSTPGTNWFYYSFAGATVPAPTARPDAPPPDPVNGAFANYLADRYLEEAIGRLFEKISSRDERYFPTAIKVREFILGTSLGSIYNGWEAQNLRPID